MAKVKDRLLKEKTIGPLEFTKNDVVRFHKQKRGRKIKTQKKV